MVKDMPPYGQDCTRERSQAAEGFLVWWFGDIVVCLEYLNWGFSNVNVKISEAWVGAGGGSSAVERLPSMCRAMVSAAPHQKPMKMYAASVQPKGCQEVRGLAGVLSPTCGPSPTPPRRLLQACVVKGKTLDYCVWHFGVTVTKTPEKTI